jgi:hypothetical protein
VISDMERTPLTAQQVTYQALYGMNRALRTTHRFAGYEDGSEEASNFR